MGVFAFMGMRDIVEVRACKRVSAAVCEQLAAAWEKLYEEQLHSQMRTTLAPS